MKWREIMKMYWFFFLWEILYTITVKWWKTLLLVTIWLYIPITCSNWQSLEASSNKLKKGFDISLFESIVLVLSNYLQILFNNFFSQLISVLFRKKNEYVILITYEMAGDHENVLVFLSLRNTIYNCSKMIKNW